LAKKLNEAIYRKQLIHFNKAQFLFSSRYSIVRLLILGKFQIEKRSVVATLVEFRIDSKICCEGRKVLFNPSLVLVCTDVEKISSV